MLFLPVFALLWHHATAATDFSVTKSNLSSWNNTQWTLTTHDYIPGQYQSRISLGNGYVGASLAAAGPFFEMDVNQTDPNGIVPSNGWPLFSYRISFSTISGFYDIQPNGTGTNYPWLNQYGYESFISGIPHPTGIVFSFGDNYLDATAKNTTISKFKSSISFKTGVATWDYTWTPEKSDTSFDISYTAFFSRVHPNTIAVKASITASSDISGNVTDLLDGRSAARAYLNSKGLDSNATSIYSSVHPDGLDNITAWVVSTAVFDNGCATISDRKEADASWLPTNDTTIGQTFGISLKAGKQATFYKYIGAASTDKFKDAETVARQGSSDAVNAGWETLLEEHECAWGEIMTEEAVDDFTDPETGEMPTDSSVEILHIASVANMYYLLQNLQPDGSDLNDNSVSVGGLQSDSYAGLVFWDADYWMAPGLNLAFPDYSKQITNYRVKQHPQALANAKFNGYPDDSSLYSWTSGRYGNCTGTGPCVDYEYHLNYDISFNILQQLNVTQNLTWFENGPKQIIESTAMMTGQLLMFNETTGTYWLHNCTDPDEYANNVDNGAFTIASASDLLTAANALRVQYGLQPNATWAKQALGIEFPTADSNITLEYQTMNNSVAVKQADVVLLTYPLDYGGSNYSIADKLLDLDYYSNRQSPNGPAMTYSIFAADANALSPSGCAAYTYTLNGFLPYLRAPWYQFSEQANDDITTNGATNPAFPFLTGHGGANQVVPFGFLGLRTDQPVLFIDPSLPPQIPHVKIRRIYFAGAGIMASMNQTHTTLTRFDTSSVTAITDIYANTTLPFKVGTPGPTGNATSHTLAINETVTIPNRRYFDNLTYDHDLLQCLPVVSDFAYADGQFPVAATDGATATSWQPKTNDSASIVVNTTSVPAQKIKGLYFNWAARPPVNVTVIFGNYSDIANGVASSGGDSEKETSVTVEVSISKPFNATAYASSAQEVVPYLGNETTFTLTEEVWTGKYVRLEVGGCVEGDGKGATVSEFVVIGE